MKVDGGTLNMTAPSDAAAAIDGGLNVVSGSAFVSGAQVGVKGTLYFDGTDMLISGAVKAVELDSAGRACRQNALRLRHSERRYRCGSWL